jgi:hypothetical protein
MASPGPRLRDLIHGNSDVEDSDSEDFPILQHQRPLLAPALSSAANSDDENPPPRRAATQKKVPGCRRGRGGTAAPTPAETTDDIEADSAYVFIDPEALVKTKKSADSDYFFGRRKIDKGFKCRLCSSVFSPLSKLTIILICPTGKNIQLVQVFPLAAFIFRILKATWKHTLLQFRNMGLKTSYRNLLNRRPMNNVLLMPKESHSL